MPEQPRPWGKIAIGVRMEKVVEADFVTSWSYLLVGGLRPGDSFAIVTNRPAHVAANEIIRHFLKDTDADSLLMLDSDAEFTSDFLSRFRDFQPGWKYDALQAFHTRRGWPPEAIWYQRHGDETFQCAVLSEGTEDVGLIGTHCALFRREIFEAIYAKNPEIPFEDFQWFCYPRHMKRSDEVTLSLEAYDLGFKLGATTEIKVGHISKVTTGWETYQEFLQLSGIRQNNEVFMGMANRIAQWLKMPLLEVVGQSMQGSKNVRDAWSSQYALYPETTREFYKHRKNGYFFDLLAWNNSSGYKELLQPLSDIEGKTVLVIGAGLGTEADLLWRKNTVDVFELPGDLKEYCKDFLGGKVNFLDGEVFNGAVVPEKRYDLVVAIDVLEHVHPDEFSEFMDTLLKSLRPGGMLYAHNNWGDHDLYPMHFDNSAVFNQKIFNAGLGPAAKNTWTTEKVK